MATHPAVPASGSLTVYATTWCPYCSRLLAGLRHEEIGATVIDVDRDADAAAAVEAINGGDRVVPTVVFPDGSTATNPSLDEVRARLSR